MTNEEKRPSVLSPEEMDAFFAQGFRGHEARPRVVEAAEGSVVLRLQCGEEHLRPGNYISGPTQMGLADHAAYAAIFTRAGITPMALTSNLNINFLRPCRGEAVEARARIMKFGRASVVVEVDILGDTSTKPASHAIVTYVMPAEG